MTYHSSKGLDFENVFIPMLTEDLDIPCKEEGKDKTLFMVAMTRSRNNLFLTYHGLRYHRFLTNILNTQGCIVKYDISTDMRQLDVPPTIPDW